MKTATRLSMLLLAAVLSNTALITFPSYAERPNTPVEANNTVTNPVPVTVLNGPANPIAVAQQGNITVSLSSSNNSVLITNTAANPVPVRTAATQPVQFIESVDLPAGVRQIFTNFSFRTPEGKRFVIEYISVDAQLPASQNLLRSKVLLGNLSQTYAALISVPHFTGISPAGGGTAIFQSGETVRGFLNYGDAIRVSVERDAVAGAAIADFTVTGHLEDL